MNNSNIISKERQDELVNVIITNLQVGDQLSPETVNQLNLIDSFAVVKNERANLMFNYKEGEIRLYQDTRGYELSLQANSIYYKVSHSNFFPYNEHPDADTLKQAFLTFILKMNELTSGSAVEVVHSVVADEEEEVKGIRVTQNLRTLNLATTNPNAVLRQAIKLAELPKSHKITRKQRIILKDMIVRLGYVSARFRFLPVQANVDDFDIETELKLISYEAISILNFMHDINMTKVINNLLDIIFTNEEIGYFILDDVEGRIYRKTITLDDRTLGIYQSFDSKEDKRTSANMWTFHLCNQFNWLYEGDVVRIDQYINDLFALYNLK